MYSQTEILPAIIKMKKNTSTQNNTDKSQKHCAKAKKPDTEEYILYGPIHKKFKNKQN